MAWLYLDDDIEILDLQDRQFEKDDGEGLGKSLETSTTLTTLKLAGKRIGSEAASFIGKSFSVNTSLTSIHLFQNEVGAAGAKAIGKALESNNTLTYLDLEENNIGVDGASGIGPMLLINSVLTILNLEYNSIGADGAKHIADGLKSNKGLTNLNLAYNNLGIEGARHISGALETNKDLLDLNLSFNEIGKDGAVIIAKALEVNHTLLGLNVQCNDIDDVNMSVIEKLMQTNIMLMLFPTPTTADLKSHAWSIDLDMSIHNSATIKMHRLLTVSAMAELNPWTDTPPKAPFEDPFINPFWDIYKEVSPRKAHMRTIPMAPINYLEEKDRLKELMEANEEWRLMKVIVLGNGRIGKTTFIHFLHKLLAPETKQNRQEADIKSTVGIEYSALDFGDGSPISIWDFAGQLEYTVTHQYFLSSKMVLYTICFDLNAEPIEQLKQVEYWLSYLNSILCNAKPIPPTHATAKWRIILVGTRADLAESEPKTPANIDNYRKAYPVLPIYHELFTISTKNDGDEQLASLCEALKVECKRILDIHSAAVPCAHKDLLQLVQASPKHIIHESDIPKVQIRWDIENTLELSLDYLHSIGEVVRFTEGRVCIKPSIISQVLAKFIAPDDHVEESRAAFKKTDVAGILKTKVSEIDQNVKDELDMLTFFGVCFPVPHAGGEEQFFLFPSIGSTVDFKFKDPKPTMEYAGVCLTAPSTSVFIPGFICQIITCICIKFNKENILQVGVNGIHITCPGILDGEIILHVRPDRRSLYLLIMATSPDIQLLINVFRELIYKNFPQYISYTHESLCETCVKTSFFQKCLSIGKMKVVRHNKRHCKQHQNEIGIVKPPLKESCRTHSQTHHHIFLNYRVATEGSTSLHPVSVVQQVYDHLSRERTMTGDPVFLFWDQKCLNYGMNWEQGFLAGLTNAAIIVLLISLPALDGIKANAAKRQDNVLYECALLRNKKGTFVVPVFVGNEKIEGEKSLYSRVSATVAATGFPDLPHARSDDANRIVQDFGKGIPLEDKEFLGTVAKTMAQVFKLQGHHLIERGTKKSELDALAEILLKIIDKQSLPKMETL